MTWIVEGFEDNLVRIEWQDKLLDLPRNMLPEVQVGDVLVLQEDGGWFRFVVDVAETRRLKHEAETELQALNQGAPEGDIHL